MTKVPMVTFLSAFGKKGFSMLYYRLFCNRWCNLEEKKVNSFFIYLFSYEPLSAIMFCSFCINLYLIYTKSIQLNFNRKDHHKTVATTKIRSQSHLKKNIHIHVFTGDGFKPICCKWHLSRHRPRAILHVLSPFA